MARILRNASAPARADTSPGVSADDSRGLRQNTGAMSDPAFLRVATEAEGLGDALDAQSIFDCVAVAESALEARAT